MRGGTLHNRLVRDTELIFREYGWKTFLEKRYCSKNVITYFDLYFRKIPDNGGYVIVAGLQQFIEYFRYEF